MISGISLKKTEEETRLKRKRVSILPGSQLAVQVHYGGGGSGHIDSRLVFKATVLFD